MKKRVVLTVLLSMCLLGGCKGKELTDYEKGMENLEKQNYKEALENFREAVSDGEDAAKAWRGIGISWSGQGAFDRAEEAFLTALDFTEKSEKEPQNRLESLPCRYTVSSKRISGVY